MKIKITDFAERHFDKNSGGTKILDTSIEDFEDYINSFKVLESLDIHLKNDVNVRLYIDIKVRSGYAPFCKTIAIKNFTDAKVGTLPITLRIQTYNEEGVYAALEHKIIY